MTQTAYFAKTVLLNEQDEALLLVRSTADFMLPKTITCMLQKEAF